MGKRKSLSLSRRIIVTHEEILTKILHFRSKKVMFDTDLAQLYEVPTYVLNQSVKRNLERFPADFMFQLTKEEYSTLTSQIVISKMEKRGGRRTLPYVFTEQGVAMLSSILKSSKAIKVNIEIMRAFAKIREMLLSHKDFQKKIEEMEKKYDKSFSMIFEALRGLLNPPVSLKKQIGFHSK